MFSNSICVRVRAKTSLHKTWDNILPPGTIPSFGLGWVAQLQGRAGMRQGQAVGTGSGYGLQGEEQRTRD
jgi:hypothetical protein